ncbi:MAG: hypothetical protein IKV86_06810 [Clostridia bacterium]|nr:hypothetical protein [Clostridia bacterium]
MKKTAIIYGSANTPLQKKALEILSKYILEYTGAYPACFEYSKGTDTSDYRVFYIGTKENNPALTSSLTHTEEYSITVKNDTVYIAGYDDLGVVYGCIDFYNKYILKYEYPGDAEIFCVNPFEKPFEDFEYSSFPAVKDRGIWTWGHVIYDYKNFFENMLMLKMNTVTIWNDFVPVNGKDIVEYAHNCGIKVIWGYSWLWTTKCAERIKESLEKAYKSNYTEFIEKYEREYAHLGGDGIYFQSFTELKEDTIDGIVIADAVTDFVNNASKHFFGKYPELEIQFGLHATSVKQKLEYIEKVDKRIRIVWEDAGSFPFSYLPDDVEDFEETNELAKKIATLRGADDNFGVVTKGFTKLNWKIFEYATGSFHIGTGTEFFKDNRVMNKRKVWKYFQSYWITNAPLAYKVIKTMADAKKGDLCITALVEDGMFEKDIMFPVALYSEMLWDNNTDINKMINEVALRNYVTFA